MFPLSLDLTLVFWATVYCFLMDECCGVYMLILLLKLYNQLLNRTVFIVCSPLTERPSNVSESFWATHTLSVIFHSVSFPTECLPIVCQTDHAHHNEKYLYTFYITQHDAPPSMWMGPRRTQPAPTNTFAWYNSLLLLLLLLLSIGVVEGTERPQSTITKIHTKPAK